MRRFRKICLLLAGVLLAAALTACGGGGDTKDSEKAPLPAKDPNWPVTLGDVRLKEKPQRIVSLSPALTEIICELGGGDRLVGISDQCDYPQEITGLPACGTAQLIDFDAIKELKPQVVFTSAPLSQEDTVRLQQMDAEVVALPRAESMEALEELYACAGTVLDGMKDGEEKGLLVFSDLQQRYNALTSGAASIEESGKLSGVYLRMTPLMMATGDTFEGKLMESIGIKNDAGAYTGWEYPADKAAELYPDVIFYDRGVDLSYLKENRVYNTTDAVKQDRCFEINAVAFERQSARMFSELEKMFAAAYPSVRTGSMAGYTGGDEEDGGASQEEPPAPPETPGQQSSGDLTNYDDIAPKQE